MTKRFELVIETTDEMEFVDGDIYVTAVAAHNRAVGFGRPVTVKGVNKEGKAFVIGPQVRFLDDDGVI